MRFLFITLLILSMPQCAFCQFQSKFGKEWPALEDCLILSEDTGKWGFLWGTNDVTAVFEEDGSFTATVPRTFSITNKFLREKRFECQFRFKGQWGLQNRPFSVTEKKQLNVPSDSKNKAYFLNLVLDGAVESEDPPQNPELRTVFDEAMQTYQTTMKGGIVLVLDEETAYPISRESQLLIVSSPKILFWRVVRDDTRRNVPVKAGSSMRTDVAMFHR